MKTVSSAADGHSVKTIEDIVVKVKATGGPANFLIRNWRWSF